MRPSRARRPSVGMRTQGVDVKYPLLERFANSAYKYILRHVRINRPVRFSLFGDQWCIKYMLYSYYFRVFDKN